MSDGPHLSTVHADRRDLVFFAVERASTPIIICDPSKDDNPIILANAAFLNLTGYRLDDVIGRNCRFLQGPSTCSQAVRVLHEAVRQARPAEVEILNYRKDGSTFWNRVNLSPAHDEQGGLAYFFASIVDVSIERQASELAREENRILLREVDHRAMNALAIVEGIVRLSRARDAAQYAAAVQRRVQALARTHAYLSERHWRAAPLHELFELQIAPFDASRATFDGPEIHIGAPLVQPLALVLHEMHANAATHGCLSTPQGLLVVRWMPSETGRGFTMVWDEVGGPPPVEPRPSGFGSAMIGAIIRRQLRGRARLNWRPSGLRAEFTVPDVMSEPKSFRIAQD
ncbi:PAS domain-containing protein [Caulobacter endophyticus]|uniref:PAS domain-containing protein n=1 Tax=Caulobacter endophyticus TaxID=2172652 RepID=UPI00240EC458|nr:PAS domain-containing protein [Caulobacter endophyticus]MDG2528115.1 PAS domain-containing protein [Caulobacter endophyticus]